MSGERLERAAEAERLSDSLRFDGGFLHPFQPSTMENHDHLSHFCHPNSVSPLVKSAEWDPVGSREDLESSLDYPNN